MAVYIDGFFTVFPILYSDMVASGNNNNNTNNRNTLIDEETKIF